MKFKPQSERYELDTLLLDHL